MREPSANWILSGVPQAREFAGVQASKCLRQASGGPYGDSFYSAAAGQVPSMYAAVAMWYHQAPDPSSEPSVDNLPINSNSIVRFNQVATLSQPDVGDNLQGFRICMVVRNAFLTAFILGSQQGKAFYMTQQIRGPDSLAKEQPLNPASSPGRLFAAFIQKTSSSFPLRSSAGIPPPGSPLPPSIFKTHSVFSPPANVGRIETFITTFPVLSKNRLAAS